MSWSFETIGFLLLFQFGLALALAIPTQSSPSSLTMPPQGSPTVAIILIAPNPSTTTVLESKPGYTSGALLFTVYPSEYDHSDDESSRDDGIITRGVITAIIVVLVILITILIAFSCVYANQFWALLLRSNPIWRSTPSSSPGPVSIPIANLNRANGHSAPQSDPFQGELPIYTPSNLPRYERGSPPPYGSPQRPSPVYQSRVNHPSA